jgi:curved DNA-binding protein
VRRLGVGRVGVKLSHYDVLGVESTATPQEIKKAFRQIARECHPDVAGEDPKSAERFKSARDAYEVLIDPVRRARYDRRGQRRRAPTGGSFFDAFYQRTAEPTAKRTGRAYGAHDSGGHGGGARRRSSGAAEPNLDDLVSDFGEFGFGGPASSGAARSRAPAARPPQPGRDVDAEVEVPIDVAMNGGTVTAVYYRMQRSDAWRPGSRSAGVARIQDLADVRVLPGTRDGQVLVERGLGDAGAHGGSYGDLRVHVKVVGRPPPVEPPRATAARSPSPPPAPPRTEAPAADPGSTEVIQRLDLSVVDALLGGRVGVDSPQGRVVVNIPAGTSGGAKLRLRGKGPLVDGVPVDLLLETRIVVPRDLDPEARALIEAFARVMPESPRSDG